jgi:hypothetical protein
MTGWASLLAVLAAGLWIEMGAHSPEARRPDSSAGTSEYTDASVRVCPVDTRWSESLKPLGWQITDTIPARIDKAAVSRTR